MEIFAYVIAEALGYCGSSAAKPAARHSDTPPAKGLAPLPWARRMFTASIVSTQHCPWQ